MNPTADQGSKFGDLIGFVSAVCNCYPKETASFPEELKSILLANHRDLSPELREKIIYCLTMLRNKNIIGAELLIQTLFPLLHAYLSTAQNSATSSYHAKAVRKQIYTTLVSLLKAVNTGAKNQKINRSTQALLFNLLELRDAQGMWATKLTRELWRRGIWDDSRTVEIMTHAALHSEPKVAVAGGRFFLGADKERQEALEDDSDDEDVDMGALRHKMLVNKKSGKRGKKIDQALKTMKKKTSAKGLATYLNFSALHLLRDPQGFAEQLFERHLGNRNANRYDLEQRIMFINLVSRLIGTHKLTVLGFYSFLLKYLTPKQRDVTQIMAASAQASHNLVPPESISIVVRKIADEFVSDGVATEVAAAGLNTIREILSRAPLAIEAPLLQDLTTYKGSKAKNVMMAARSLISLYREVAPEMLARKDRGKVASMELQHGEKKGVPTFGVDNSAVTSIPGIELLAKWRAEQGLQDGDDDDEANWEVDSMSDASDIEGEWKTVGSGDEIEISDSEDEKENDENSVGTADVDNDADDGDSDSDLELSEDEKDNAEDEEGPAKKKIKSDPAAARAQAEAAANELFGGRIMTPADFAKLKELRTEAGVEKILGNVQNNEDEVDSTTLVGKMKYKQLKEERLAHVKEGREDREKFGSKKGNRDAPHSTTNKEKARKKNFVMMIHKKAVQGKQKLSLRDRQRVLRAHIDKQKRKGH